MDFSSVPEKLPPCRLPVGVSCAPTGTGALFRWAPGCEVRMEGAVLHEIACRLGQGGSLSMPRDSARPAVLALAVQRLVAAGYLERTDQPTPTGPPATYLPVQCRLAEPGALVTRWLSFPSSGLSSPFFLADQWRAERAPDAQWFELSTLPSPATLAQRLQPKGWIFHGSRSGSTLLARLIGCDPLALVLSEPTVLNELAGLPAVDSPLRVASLVLGLGGRFTPPQEYSIVKLSSYLTPHLATYGKAFPDVPWVYLLRSPAEIVASHLDRPGRWFEGSGKETGARHLLTMLEQGYRAVLEAYEGGRGRILSYRPDFASVRDSALEHFSLSWNEPIRARAEELSKRHSHHDRPFIPRPPNPEAQRLVLELGGSQLATLYEELRARS